MDKTNKKQPLYLEKDIVNARIEGMKDGIRLYAWWKDGVQYVGTCGTTLKDALKEIQ